MDIKFLEVKRAYYNDPENVRLEYFDGHKWWANNDSDPLWDEARDWRIKPKTIRIGDIDVPEPVRKALGRGCEFWVVSFLHDSFCFHDYWEDCDIDKIYLTRGLIHLTREAAELHAKALILVSGGSVE